MQIDKPFLKMLRPASRRLGFSAIEVIAVATIIALLALILVPQVVKRVDEAKIAAAKDDMVAIEKAEQLAYGYTSHYFRLCDLKRPTPESNENNPPPLGPALIDNKTVAAQKIPGAYWNKPIPNLAETNYLVNNWHGPFIAAFHNQLPLAQLAAARPEMCNTVNGADAFPGAVTFGGGPIFLFRGDAYDWLHPNGDALADISNGPTWPIDPWGNPYVFFGSGAYGQDAADRIAIQTSQQTYSSCAIYCLGPDGQPGLGTGNLPRNFFRENVTIGTGDDLKREF